MPTTTLAGTRLRQRRLTMGLRQADLAARAGISASYLNLIEHNRRRIGPDVLTKLAAALGLPEAALSEGAEGGLLEDLRAAARPLTNAAAGQYGFQFGTIYDHTGWIWWQHQPENFWATPQIFPKQTAWSSDSGRGVMQIIHGLTVEDNSTIPVEESDSYDVYGGGFGVGKVALYAGGDWDAGWSFRELPFNWGMAMLPTVRKEFRPALNTMVASHVVSAATKNPELAWAFIRFLTADTEGQTLIGQGAYETPVLKSVAMSDPIMKPTWAPPGYDARVRAALLPGPMYTPYPLTLNLWEFPEKILDPTVLRLRAGELTPDEAVAFLDQEGTPFFQQQQ